MKQIIERNRNGKRNENNKTGHYIVGQNKKRHYGGLNCAGKHHFDNHHIDCFDAGNYGCKRAGNIAEAAFGKIAHVDVFKFVADRKPVFGTHSVGRDIFVAVGDISEYDFSRNADEHDAKNDKNIAICNRLRLKHRAAYRQQKKAERAERQSFKHAFKHIAHKQHRYALRLLSRNRIYFFQ